MSEEQEMTEEQIMDRLTAKFEAEDEALDERDDSDTQDEDEQDDDSDDHADDDAEHTDAGTSADDPDGDAAESDEDSDDDASEADDDADDEGTSDDESESDEAGDDDAEDEEAEEGDAVSKETTDALTKHGAQLTIDDVPEKYRPVIVNKLKNLDAAFSRATAEARAYRAEEVKLRADQKYRDENPDLVIVEMIQKYPDILDKVNKRLTRLDRSVEGADEEAVAEYEEAFRTNVRTARQKAEDAIKAELTRAEQLAERAETVESYARTQAKKLNVPWTAVERLVAAEINLKPADKRDITTEEIDAVVGAFAKEHNRSVRAHRREESKRVVQQRTAKRQAPQSTVRAPKAGTSPVAAKRKDPGGSLEDRLLRSAKRIMPGSR